MTSQRTGLPFREELPRLLGERGMSIRALAREVGVTDAHISRVLRGADYKTASPDLARRVGAALGLPRGYFVEDRLGAVLEYIRVHPRVRDELYDRFSGRRA